MRASTVPLAQTAGRRRRALAVGLLSSVLAATAATPVTAITAATPAAARTMLFVGNSFTFAQESAVRFYRSATVIDLNGEHQGGVPALFKSFAAQAGLAYAVALETHPGVGLEWHLEHAMAVIGRRPWDTVVLQSYSTLDVKRPGDPATLIASVHTLADALRDKNPAVQIFLTATWPRADQIYPADGAWHGKPLEAMARDVRAGYELAAAGTPGVQRVVAVGDAWVRAVQAGVADGNPYDGIDAGKIDLWAYDHYHGSTFGYYLEALMVFGSVTGRDPRSLGVNECSAFELGLSTETVAALQKVAFDQLVEDGVLNASTRAAPRNQPRAACTG